MVDKRKLDKYYIKSKTVKYTRLVCREQARGSDVAFQKIRIFFKLLFSKYMNSFDLTRVWSLVKWRFRCRGWVRTGFRVLAGKYDFMLFYCSFAWVELRRKDVLNGSLASCLAWITTWDVRCYIWFDLNSNSRLMVKLFKKTSRQICFPNGFQDKQEAKHPVRGSHKQQQKKPHKANLYITQQ